MRNTRELLKNLLQIRVIVSEKIFFEILVALEKGSRAPRAGGNTPYLRPEADCCRCCLLYERLRERLRLRASSCFAASLRFRSVVQSTCCRLTVRLLLLFYFQKMLTEIRSGQRSVTAFLKRRGG